MILKEHAPLALLTTFKIGGAARFLLRVRSQRELEEALTFAKEKKLPICILGGGSNTLFDDSGFSGIVIKIENVGIILEDDLLIAEAGESWDGVVAYAIEHMLWGIENLSGIPGTVGGAAVQNIGAYGAALSQTVAWVEVFDCETSLLKRLSRVECEFGYRTSVFKQSAGRFVVLRAALRLHKEGKPDLSYKDIANVFAGKTPTLKEIRSAVLAIRAKKFPDLKQEGTAGSFFKNPVLSQEETQKLTERFPTIPLFPLPESSGMKVPLAWFLDARNGVLDIRDMRVGSARLFAAQPLVIAVTWPAQSKDVIELSKVVQEKIKIVVGIEIEPEVCIVLSTPSQ